MTGCKSPAQKAERFSSVRGGEGHSEGIITYRSEKPERQAQLQSCRLWVEVGGGQTLRPDSDVEITAWTRKAQTPPTRIQKHLHLLSELIQGTLSGSCAVV